MSCEVCGADHSLGAMVPGAALTKGEIVQLCSTCRDDIGVRASRPASRMPWARAVLLAGAALLSIAAVAGIGFSSLIPSNVVAALEFYLGAVTATAIFSAFRIIDDTPALPRRPAIDQDTERNMSNSKLLAHLRAVSDFPEEDFMMLRPNSALARKLQRERALQPPGPEGWG